MNGLTASLGLMAARLGELLTKYLFPDEAKGFTAEPRPSRAPQVETSPDLHHQQ